MTLSGLNRTTSFYVVAKKIAIKTALGSYVFSQISKTSPNV